jgi:hypothetical protein
VPKNNTTLLDRFVFQGDPKVPESDRRVLAGFAVSQAYDNLHLATEALKSMNRTWWCLNQLFDGSKRMVESGLVTGPAAQEEMTRIEEQQARLVTLEPMLQDLADDRHGRLHEITEWEEAMQREQARRLRPKPKKKATKTKRQLLPAEEPVAVGMDLDPKVLAATVKSLRSLGKLEPHEE